MSSLDLPEIRARLAANGRDRRQGGGALKLLRGLLSNQPPRPLLGPPGDPPKGPSARPPSPELELLDPDSEPPIELELRRSTFGRRDAAAFEDESIPLLLTLTDSARGPLAALTFDPAEPSEASPSQTDAFDPEAAARLDQARKLLEILEDRLREEQDAFERRAALR